MSSTLSALLSALLLLGCASSTPPPRAEPADREPPAEEPAAPRPRQRPIIAVFNIQASGVQLHPNALERLSEFLAVLMVESDAYRVIPRSQVLARLRQQKKESYKPCYDQDCQIEIGRELAAQKSLATRIIRLGSRCTVTTALYDLRSSTAETAARQEVMCDEASLAEGLVPLVSRVSGTDLSRLPPAGAEQDPAAESASSGLGQRVVITRKARSIRLSCPECELDDPKQEKYMRRLQKIYMRNLRARSRSHRSSYKRSR
jgi:hypothetical protein